MRTPESRWIRRILSLTPLLIVVACGKQTEGERCSTLSGNSDCDQGLECVSGDELQSGRTACCPPPDEVTLNACARRTAGGAPDAGGGAGGTGAGGSAGGAGRGGGGTGGASGSSGRAGSAGQAGADAAAVCSYDSDCPGNLVCGPGGACQPECRTGKDCPPPRICVGQECVLPEAGADA